MSRKIYYYSRTGNCARVAYKYAKDKESYLVQIMDVPEDRYWGAWGFIKGAINTLSKKEVSYRLVGDRYIESSEIVLITPVWAGQIPPTFRSFLQNESFASDLMVHVVTVSRSGRGRDAFRQVVKILEKAGVREIRHRNLKENEIE
ncbi:hypothetical protein BBF96_01515 [Anoxybacter fermentans]|uniref:Flavodoxin-like domain-containing protein n=1 Tax=Anoxybacter fermentans TaxID=1323375 RepID=A0A3S9SV82_9FIRM|nr:hypothetical protein [Anoxybacter fermentans]AZR72188.1 hypothetical protein BBF96_01515 [Anoxybacter fermentans]